jgi:DNA-binding MarR family transcriptional regulator
MNNKNEQLTRLTQAHNLVSNIRQLITQKLPVQNSLIPLDILLVILDIKNADCLTVKQLVASVSQSHTGFRYHFSRLIKDDWIELKTVETDKRTRIVVPTRKLLNKFEEFAEELYMGKDA